MTLRTFCNLVTQGNWGTWCFLSQSFVSVTQPTGLLTASHWCDRLSKVLKSPNMESWKQVAYSGITAFSAPLFAQTVVSLDLDCFKGSGHYLRCTNEGAIKKQRPIYSTGKNTLVSQSLI